MLLFGSLSLQVVTLSLLGQGSALAIQRRASAGCGTPHKFPGESREFSFESSGGTRTYRIHLPSTYDPNNARPLLIAYHGSGGNPADFEAETQLSDESINSEMITVYPAGVDVSFETMSLSSELYSNQDTGKLARTSLRNTRCQRQDIHH